MGGYACFIAGTVDESLLRPRPAKRTLVDRLLKRRPVRQTRWNSLGTSRMFMELPSEALTPLLERFGTWLDARFPEPWPATRTVRDYLDAGVASLALRGEREGEDTPAEWYVQLSFSGCAGLGEVSARVAAHWAEHWLAGELEGLAHDVLRPAGFTPSGVDDRFAEHNSFLPMERGGYALYHPEPSPCHTQKGETLTHFEVDEAAIEELGSDDIIRRLESNHAGLMADGRCRCQLCDPDGPVE